MSNHMHCMDLEWTILKCCAWGRSKVHCLELGWSSGVQCSACGWTGVECGKVK